MEVEVEVAGVAKVELVVLRLRPDLRLEVLDAPDHHVGLLAAALPRGPVVAVCIHGAQASRGVVLEATLHTTLPSMAIATKMSCIHPRPGPLLAAARPLGVSRNMIPRDGEIKPGNLILSTTWQVPGANPGPARKH